MSECILIFNNGKKKSKKEKRKREKRSWLLQELNGKFDLYWKIYSISEKVNYIHFAWVF